MAASGRIGVIRRYQAKSSEFSTGSSGKVTVTLSDEAGRSVVLELSYTQDPVGGWTFSLDNDPFPEDGP